MASILVRWQFGLFLRGCAYFKGMVQEHLAGVREEKWPKLV